MRRTTRSLAVGVLLGALPAVAMTAVTTARATAAAASSHCSTHASSDFNDDGFSDLAVGAPGATANDDESAGRVTIFDRSAAGPRLLKSWSQETPGVPGATAPDDDFGSALTTADFNGDGCADLAIAASGDQVNQTGNPLGAGTVTILYGSRSTGLTATGAQLIRPAALPDPNVTCDGDACAVFAGRVLAAGDINGDGYADLLIASEYVEPDGDAFAGELTVVPGSATGLQSAEAYTFPLGQRPLAASWTFGGIDSMAVGDIDGDGIADVAVGYDTLCRCDDDGQAHEPPGVDVIYGSKAGLDGGRAAQAITRDSPGVPGADQDGSSITVALGDFHHDGHDDLAFTESRGPLDVLAGTSTGLSFSHVQAISKNTKGIKGAVSSADYRWGAALATGDFNHDGTADLAIGDPLTQAASVLYGRPGRGLVATGNQLLSPSTPHIPGTVQRGGQWSATLAAGNYGLGPATDLAVGAPGVSASRGAVTMLFGSASHPAGLDPATATQRTRNSPGVPGLAAALDQFGAAL